ncbi:MAG: DUF1127 domain-containing protein [Rhodobacteraceae bacterium]|nr:DUF1127 domain-containing protein [Paracoccaceae bacterium]
MANETTPKSNGLLARLSGFLRTRREQRINRAVFKNLLALDEHILKDIGVTRGDVIWAANLPIEKNAACELERLKSLKLRRG